MKQKLTNIQSQKLAMTPELKQAINILQYNSVTLQEFIAEELLNNPVLEKQSQDLVSLESLAGNEYKLANLSISNKASTSPSNNDNLDNHKLNNYEINETLRDSLNFQLTLTSTNKEQEKIGRYIIANIDNNGFLNMDVKLAATKLNTSVHSLDQTINLIQTFEPIGVGARSLSECLLIQLEQNMAIDSDLHHLTATLISHHLHDLGALHFDTLSLELNTDQETIKEAYSIITKLNPKPGQSFKPTTKTKFIRPDLYLNNQGQLSLNPQLLPKLTLSNHYLTLSNDPNLDDKTKNYLNQKLRSATSIIKAIEQRNETLLKVSQAIISHNKAFFKTDSLSLAPLTMKELALKLEIHESTVSRAVSDKYLQSPKGLHPLKHFFQRGIRAGNGTLQSAQSIKNEIINLIQSEDPKKPLSDQSLANQLSAAIARRTVTKYREQLKIPSSSIRKRRYLHSI